MSAADDNNASPPAVRRGAAADVFVFAPVGAAGAAAAAAAAVADAESVDARCTGGAGAGAGAGAGGADGAPLFEVPWTLPEARSDAVSKRDLILFLQARGSPAFLSEHKLAGRLPNVLKKTKKHTLVGVYAELLRGDRFAGSETAVKPISARREARIRAEYAADDNSAP